MVDILVVGVGRDTTITKLKGPGRPINHENERVFLVSQFKSVDYAILDDEEMLPGKIDFYSIIKELKPDLFILNDDDSAIREKRELCNSLGIELKLIPRATPESLKPNSSTKLISKIKNILV